MRITIEMPLYETHSRMRIKVLCKYTLHAFHSLLWKSTHVHSVMCHTLHTTRVPFSAVKYNVHAFCRVHVSANCMHSIHCCDVHTYIPLGPYMATSLLFYGPL